MMQPISEVKHQQHAPKLPINKISSQLKSTLISKVLYYLHNSHNLKLYLETAFLQS